MYSSTLQDLFRAFLRSSDHFLSHEDIRQDVLCNEDASGGSIRTLIWEARRWLRLHKPSYEIITKSCRGYTLCRKRRESLPAAERASELAGCVKGGCADW